jgi:signal peptidase
MRDFDMDVKTVLLLSFLSVFVISFLITGPVLIPFSGVVSDSMEPSIQVGDMVVISSLENPNPVVDTTIHPASESSDGFPSGENGSVVVFTDPDASNPVIHRVIYDVDRGENWVIDANQSAIPSGWGCGEIEQCPAPHDGYITKGDNNTYFDQTGSYSVVGREDILGIAIIYIPDGGFISEMMYDQQESGEER